MDSIRILWQLEKLSETIFVLFNILIVFSSPEYTRKDKIL
ncbi:hypothetical protein pb186bvf_019657 [Paramecium bursaria]